MNWCKKHALQGEWPLPERSRQAGVTLVELIISMVILALVATGAVAALTQAKYKAEYNLYRATSLTVAISTIEQMKGATLNFLSNPPKDADGDSVFELIVGGDQVMPLKLGEANIIRVPIITDEVGAAAKELELTLTPEIEASKDYAGYWLELTYSWEHPRSNIVYTETLRNMRSTVPTI